MIKCDIENPTKAGRAIYDGMGGKTPIYIGPGITVKDVVLAEHVAIALRDKAKADDPRDPKALRVVERGVVGEPFDPPDPTKALDLSAMISEQVARQVSETFRRELTALSDPKPASKK